MFLFSQRASALIAGLLLASTASGSPVGETTSSSTSSAPTAALVQTTISGTPTAVEIAAPATGSATSTTQTTAASTTAAADQATATDSVLASDRFPTCNDASTTFGPFCLPTNGTEIYVGSTYYVTWNPDKFSPNSTITIILNYANDSNTQVWSSAPVENNVSYTTITPTKEWLKDNDIANLTFIAVEYDRTTSSRAKPVDGPDIGLTKAPAKHYEPPPHTKVPDKLGLLIGLPVSLGFVVIVVIGLLIGNRKTRHIDLGKLMGRNRGYDSRKSRRQMLGGKKGAIRLQERELHADELLNQYRDEPLPPKMKHGHVREVSLGSLVSTESDRDRERRFAPSAFKNQAASAKSWR